MGTSSDALPERIQLRLYLAGQTPNSALALSNLKAILQAHAHDLEVVDVLQCPERALEDGVFATPTLIKLRPGSPMSFVGTLNDRATMSQKILSTAT